MLHKSRFKEETSVIAPHLMIYLWMRYLERKFVKNLSKGAEVKENIFTENEYSKNFKIDGKFIEKKLKTA